MLTADARLLHTRASPDGNLVLKLNCHTAHAVTSSFLWRTPTSKTADALIICRVACDSGLPCKCYCGVQSRCSMSRVSHAACCIPCKRTLIVYYSRVPNPAVTISSRGWYWLCRINTSVFHKNRGFPAWVGNHTPINVWNEIIYPFSNFNCCTIEVWEWISNFIKHFHGHVITYPY